jgi:hypothetical protein
MTSVLDKMYLDKSLIEPEVLFNTPEDVVVSHALTVSQKIEVLERWSQSLQDRIRATGEGMQPAAGQTAKEAETVKAIGKAITVVEMDDCGS